MEDDQQIPAATVSQTFTVKVDPELSVALIVELGRNQDRETSSAIPHQLMELVGVIASP
jgi:hypothetical protein